MATTYHSLAAGCSRSPPSSGRTRRPLAALWKRPLESALVLSAAALSCLVSLWLLRLATSRSDSESPPSALGRADVTVLPAVEAVPRAAAVVDCAAQPAQPAGAASLPTGAKGRTASLLDGEGSDGHPTPVGDRGHGSIRDGAWLRDAQRYTQQQCFINSDESELCIYDGPVCYDGTRVFVTVEQPSLEGRSLSDGTTMCADHRFYELSANEFAGCSYAGSGERTVFEPPLFGGLDPGALGYPAATEAQEAARIGGLNPPDLRDPSAAPAYLKSLQEDLYPDVPLPSVESSLPLTLRRWGPLGRSGDQWFREVTPDLVFGPGTAGKENKEGKQGSSLRGGAAPAPRSDGSDIDGALPEPAPPLPDGSPRGLSVKGPLPVDTTHAPTAALGIKERYVVEVDPGNGAPATNHTVDWIDGSLWLVGVDTATHENPFHWMTKMGMLFDAQRNNATGPVFGAHPADGYAMPTSFVGRGMAPSVLRTWEAVPGGRDPLREPSANRLAWRTGPQWAGIPPQDHVMVIGPGAVDIKSEEALGAWFRTTAQVAAQPHARFHYHNHWEHLKPVLAPETPASGGHMVCARSSAIVGVKHRIFTSRADHWLYRAAIYSRMGLLKAGFHPHPRYPPRTITVIDRLPQYGRNIHNKDAVLALLQATGLPVRYIPDMRFLPWEEQVSIMAGTGILVASHGASLANSMFMPAHGVVVELFPYLMKKWSYSNLASTAGLIYYPVHSWERVNDSYASTYYGVELMQAAYWRDNCVATNMSSYEANVYHACNSASKYYPIVVPLDVMAATVRDAVDAIGAYNGHNPAWQAAKAAAEAAAAATAAEAEAKAAAAAQAPPPPPLAADDGPVVAAKAAAAAAGGGGAVAAPAGGGDDEPIQVVPHGNEGIAAELAQAKAAAAAAA